MTDVEILPKDEFEEAVKALMKAAVDDASKYVGCNVLVTLEIKIGAPKEYEKPLQEYMKRVKAVMDTVPKEHKVNEIKSLN